METPWTCQKCGQPMDTADHSVYECPRSTMERSNLTPEECAAIFYAGFRVGIGYATTEEAKKDFGRKYNATVVTHEFVAWMISEINILRNKATL